MFQINFTIAIHGISVNFIHMLNCSKCWVIFERVLKFSQKWLNTQKDRVFFLRISYVVLSQKCNTHRFGLLESYDYRFGELERSTILLPRPFWAMCVCTFEVTSKYFQHKFCTWTGDNIPRQREFIAFRNQSLFLYFLYYHHSFPLLQQNSCELHDWSRQPQSLFW